MSDESTTIHADLAFLRGLAQDAGPTLRIAGSIMVLAGVVFGLSAIRLWLMGIGWIDWPEAWRSWLGWDALVVHVALTVVLLTRLGAWRRKPPRGGAGGTAVSAAISAVGFALTAAVAALAIAAVRLEDARLVLLVFPIVIFALAGAAWWVAYAVYRRAWALFAAGGCVVTALTLGWFAGTPTQWLALGLGLLCWLAAPGYALVRQAEGQTRVRDGAQRSLA